MIFELKELFGFSEILFNLLEGGLSLPYSLSVMKDFSKTGKRICTTCSEVLENLKCGSSFFMALKSVSGDGLKFPDWYLSFVNAAEKSGNLKEIFGCLVNILKKQETIRSKLAGAVLYPSFIALMALAGGILAVLLLPGMIGTGEAVGKTGSSLWGALSSGIIFLSVCYGIMFGAVFRLISQTSDCVFFYGLGMLYSAGISVEEALNVLRPVLARKRRLENAVMLTLEKLEQGKKISAGFNFGFSEAGLKHEAFVLHFNLYFSEITGRNDGFMKAAESIEKFINAKINRFLQGLEPFLMFVTAAFLSLILKDIFSPVFMGINGGAL